MTSWFIVGLIFTFILGKDLIAEEELKEILVRDLYKWITLSLIGILLGYITAAVYIAITADEYLRKHGDKVLWRFKKKKDEE